MTCKSTPCSGKIASNVTYLSQGVSCFFTHARALRIFFNDLSIGVVHKLIRTYLFASSVSGR